MLVQKVFCLRKYVFEHYSCEPARHFQMNESQFHHGTTVQEKINNTKKYFHVYVQTRKWQNGYGLF